MGASFRHADQIRALAGCDYLTINPTLQDEIKQTKAPIERALTIDQASSQTIGRIDDCGGR